VRVLPKRRWLRRLIVWGTVATVGMVGVTLAGGAWLYSRSDIDTVGKVEFTNPLSIPPILDPDVDLNGRSVFRLDLQEGETALTPDGPAETWGVNGSYLGPTVRAERGDEVLMQVANGLPEPTTLHWHGMHLPAHADGNPHQLIEPGDTWEPSWRIDQPASTLWYHPHPHGRTADHVYRGVAGLFLIDDPANDPGGLPDDYGVDDIPVILQDKRFKDDGSLDHSTPSSSTIGQLGDEILVNGTRGAYLDVTHERVRLRVLNASNGRIYNLRFADDRPFSLIGTDGGLLTEPDETTQIQVSPGERVEIVVTMTPGERVVLRSDSPDLGVNFWTNRFSGGDDRFDILEMRAADELTESADVPSRLADDELPDPNEAVTTRQFELNGESRINQQEHDMARVDTVVAVDSTELWEVTNDSGRPHNFHVHDVQFRVLAIDGEPPPPRWRGPKDTVYVPPDSTVRIAVRFTDYTDPETPYMYHCHVLAHEDNGMMGQFTVVKPVDVDTAPTTIDHHGHSR
jgi:FtsP/CotA-like multicopper oxidase with cupredoxin domain